jgi:hypothetical protein
LGHVDQSVHADFPRDRGHNRSRFQVFWRNGQTEVDSRAADNDPMNVGWLKQVSDHDLSASGSKGR